MRSKTDPFKVIILIALLINIGLTISNMTGTSEVYQQVADIHEHVESMPVEEQYEEQQVVNTANLPIHHCEINGEYQIEVEMDGILIYDAGRYVGFKPFNNDKFDKLIMKDNQ